MRNKKHIMNTHQMCVVFVSNLLSPPSYLIALDDKAKHCQAIRTQCIVVKTSVTAIFGVIVYSKRDMVKCELRVAYVLRVTSYELHLLCELRVASCTYYASCELRVERKVRVGNSKVRVETKSASCLFSFVERPFSSNKKVF